MEGLIGLIGGGIFYLSWMYQAYLTRKNKKMTFDSIFFIIRIIASLILLFESIRINSFVFTLIYIGTVFMMLYNLWDLKRRKGEN